MRASGIVLLILGGITFVLLAASCGGPQWINQYIVRYDYNYNRTYYEIEQSGLHWGYGKYNCGYTLLHEIKGEVEFTTMNITRGYSLQILDVYFVNYFVKITSLDLIVALERYQVPLITNWTAKFLVNSDFICELNFNQYHEIFFYDEWIIYNAEWMEP